MRFILCIFGMFLNLTLHEVFSKNWIISFVGLLLIAIAGTLRTRE